MASMRRSDRPAINLMAALVFAMAAAPTASFGHEDTPANGHGDGVNRGATLFATAFTPDQGLGPLFNRTSCSDCHSEPAIGGMGPNGISAVARVGRLVADGFDPLTGAGGPIARTRSVAELGFRCDLAPAIPAGANVISTRNAPSLYGTGLIDAIPDGEIAAGAVPRGDGILGRTNLVRTRDGRIGVGRFGWKADTATLKQFVAEAFRNELGITSPLAPTDLLPARRTGRHPCPGEGVGIEDDGGTIDAVTAFVASLPAPSPKAAPEPAGEALFHEIGCSSCHTPSLSVGDGRRARLYSDLLLHDLGADLDDKMVQGLAGGRDWRTTPLWGLASRRRFLHDGRASSPADAIVAHGGEAEVARLRFLALSPQNRDALLRFLDRL